MSERYTKISSLPKVPYPEELRLPLEVSAGALLFDNQSGFVLAQIKFRNISSKIIKSVAVNIHVRDRNGAKIDGVKGFVYNNLMAVSGDYFGDNVPIIIPEKNSYRFLPEIVCVEFSDGTIWGKRIQQVSHAVKTVEKQTISVAQKLAEEIDKKVDKEKLKENIKETGKHVAQATKEAGKATLKLPPLIANIILTVVMVIAEISTIKDYIAYSDDKMGVAMVFLGLATIVSIPGIGKLILKDKYGKKERILRWVIFAAIIVVDLIIVQFV